MRLFHFSKLLTEVIKTTPLFDLNFIQYSMQLLNLADKDFEKLKEELSKKSGECESGLKTIADLRFEVETLTQQLKDDKIQTGKRIQQLQEDVQSEYCEVNRLNY